MLRSESLARQRLLHQFSTSSVLTLLERIDVRLHGRWSKALRSLRLSLPGSPLRSRFEAALVEAAVDTLAKAPSHAASGSAGDLLRASAALLGPRLSANEREQLARDLDIEVPADRDVRAIAPAERPASDETVVSDGLPVEDAGIVLLHPFLRRFFEALGLAKDDVLLQPARAALLLHHLATGALTAEEHELVLAKVLCGLPVELPLAKESPVTAQEQSEAGALLDSAVRHWDTLRNTTADGLRGNFLSRRGRIELRDDDWLLRVEPRSYDHLLDSLPWGFAHVKLPWMPRLMHVEWSP